MKRASPVAILIILVGCHASKIERTTKSHDAPAVISLYPGYVAKSDGRIYWFSEKPKFDHDSGSWHSSFSVEITSCVADPWPYGSGDERSVMRIGVDPN